MNAQWENLVMSSMMLYIDNAVSSNGGYTNHVGKFYKTQTQYNGLHSYSLPFKQIVSDASVTGAAVLQGVDIDGNFKAIGDDGFKGILHHKGTLLFDQNHDDKEIIGSFAVKEFNVYITTKAERDLLFKTAKWVNPKVQQVESGLDPNTEAYPAIFLKNMGGGSEPLAFGHVEDTVSYVRAVVLSNSAFSLDAVCGLLKKSAKYRIPIIENVPFNAIGAYDGTALFDYASLASQASLSAMLWNVSVSKVMPQTGPTGDLNLEVFAGFVDFEVRSFGTEL